MSIRSSRTARLALAALFLALSPAVPSMAEPPAGVGPSAPAPVAPIVLANERVRATLTFTGGHLRGERLETLPAWALGQGPGAAIETDAGFRIEMVWADWRPPGRANNADNEIDLGPEDFTLTQQSVTDDHGDRVASLIFAGPDELGLEILYRLPAGAHYLRRHLRIFDPKNRGHFVHYLWTLDADVKSDAHGRAPGIVKDGGFGQPIALTVGGPNGGGAFAALEWPAAHDTATLANGRLHLRCGQEIGEPVTPGGVLGERAVLAVTPNAYVKLWFTRYLDDVRVAPLRPYTLYNSWYDLRSADYPGVEPQHVMNEHNVQRIVKTLRENMIEKHGIKLDAFVLDDGWDVYRSDWVLRPLQFPRGLKPIADELAKTQTRLGMWFGPTGGYSFRKERLAWMRDHDYETLGDQLWVGGPKYSALLRKRTTDMAKDGVAYFKWDGFQFTGSGPALGTPPGIYARRAVLKTVAGLARSVRDVRPDMFLNITSGTWLSPWWLTIANQIWMDGEDYGSADVPSISTRDSAITYRDLVLYEDFKTKGLWFPVANLMTHGILKGAIDIADIGKGEPLSKFADEVSFYLARGVTMHELYISPDILSEGEWTVLADALAWARDRFPVLKQGELIGGDPNRREPYGYAHFAGSSGIFAVRNPDIRPGRIVLALDPAQGLDPAAKGLVLERVYPTRWTAPRLLAAGDRIDVPLLGYEAAIYELRPLAQDETPLLAGVTYEATEGGIAVLDAGADARVLNPAALAGATIDGKKAGADWSVGLRRPSAPWITDTKVASSAARLEATFTLAPSARQATFAVLLRPDAKHGGQDTPAASATLDGRPAALQTVDAKGVWAWYTCALDPGKHQVALAVAPGKDGEPWAGKAEVWITGTEEAVPRVFVLEAKPGRHAPPVRPLPPTGRGAHELPRSVELGEGALSTAP